MSRNAFHYELDQLMREVRRMGLMVEESIAKAVAALEDLNMDLAREVVDNDATINEMNMQIEQSCMHLMALQQPMASDLRQVMATLKIVTDLERIADHSVEIARVTLRIQENDLIKPLVDIPEMARIAQQMVADAVSAFVSRDKERALKMIAMDHEVDALYKKVICDLTDLMSKDPTKVMQGVQLLFAGRAVERIGDHATNLGEWLIYLATGQRAELNQ
ncbi:MAG TPA: phosphate signaling complex protein PhoU [Symbiobacteriaceae bacterium]|nr:phosphate signaling complex protein PhoU [Symbiobacteriaceae bacterium]